MNGSATLALFLLGTLFRYAAADCYLTVCENLPACAAGYTEMTRYYCDSKTLERLECCSNGTASG